MIAYSIIGGKYSCLKWLLPVLEGIPHTIFVDAFAGSAVVSLNKKPVPVEVINDLNGETINFFKVLRNNEQELIHKLNLTLYSKQEWEEAIPNDKDSDVERARKFFVRARQTRNCIHNGNSSWAYSTKRIRRGMAENVSKWWSSIDGLDEIADRLRNMQILNDDALKVIKKYDDETALLYLDPPNYLYGDNQICKNLYQFEYKVEDHENLLKLITTLKSKIVISGYDNKLYNEHLTPELGWTKQSEGVKLSPSSTSKDGKHGVREEIVWIKR